MESKLGVFESSSGLKEPTLASTSRSLSRCMTALSAISKLSILNEKNELTLALLGVDDVEMMDVEGIFGPLFEGLHRKYCLERLNLQLVGPNIPLKCVGISKFIYNGALEVMCDASTELYHDFIKRGEGKLSPHLAVLFNAGLWGYESWTPTIQSLADCGIPVLVTSYTLAECRADMDRVEEILGEENIRWHWLPSPNEHAGSVDMQRTTHADRYFENFASMCFSGDALTVESPPGCPLITHAAILRVYNSLLENDKDASALGLYQTRCALITLLGKDVPIRGIKALLGWDAESARKWVTARDLIELVLCVYAKLSPEWYDRALFSEMAVNDGRGGGREEEEGGGGGGNPCITATSFKSALSRVAPHLVERRGDEIFALMDTYSLGKIPRSQFRRMVHETC